jgi:hypothetical protein
MLAKKVCIPHWALKKRARELGLVHTKELPWSEPELDILARYAWMSDERIIEAGIVLELHSPQLEVNSGYSTRIAGGLEPQPIPPMASRKR